MAGAFDVFLKSLNRKIDVPEDEAGEEPEEEEAPAPAGDRRRRRVDPAGRRSGGTQP